MQSDRKIFEETKHTHLATHTWRPIARNPWKGATHRGRKFRKFLYRKNPQPYGPPKKKINNKGP